MTFVGEAATVDVRDPALWAHPYPVLAAARAVAPVARTPAGPLLFLRHVDVDMALRHHALATAAIDTLLLGNDVTDGPLWDWCHRIMLSNDPPVHTRLRAPVTKAFSARRIEAVRAPVRAHARALLDQHRDDGRIEWVGQFAHELPIWVICELIGVPVADRDQFKRWTIDISLVFSNVLTPEGRLRATEALEALFDYVRALIADRRRHPHDDFISALLDPGVDDPLDDLEVESLIANLLSGGHMTSRSLLSSAIVVLTDNPGQVSLLQAKPNLVPDAVEELLRYESPVFSTMRVARRPLQLGDVTVDTGETVILSFLAANRDPDRFPEPDRFDVRRPDVRPVSFGFGIHHCVGAALARLEIAEALAELVTTCTDLQLECEPTWVPFAQVRQISALPLHFSNR